MSRPALIARHGDLCPCCGGTEIWQALEKAAHNGPVFIDGCGKCGEIWERETRAAPAVEPCSNCAWMEGSPEIKSGEIYGLIASCIEGKGIFYCHKRVPIEKDRASGRKGFKHEINAAGDRCTNATVCAGWIKAKQREKQAHDLAEEALRA